MRTWHGVTGRAGRVIGVMLLWVLAVALLAMAHVERSHAVIQPADKLEATIFSYDGTDFVRTKTTVVTADGKSAAGRNGPSADVSARVFAAAGRSLDRGWEKSRGSLIMLDWRVGQVRDRYGRQEKPQAS